MISLTKINNLIFKPLRHNTPPWRGPLLQNFKYSQFSLYLKASESLVRTLQKLNVTCPSSSKINWFWVKTASLHNCFYSLYVFRTYIYLSGLGIMSVLKEVYSIVGTLRPTWHIVIYFFKLLWWPSMFFFLSLCASYSYMYQC